MTKQLFLSHAWGNDNLNRDNHARCKLIHDKLKERHYSVWLDDNEMYGNIDSATMKGIDGASAILLCLTEKYCNKINNAVNNNSPNDNCYKEWNYSLFKQKLIIPIIMEPEMRDIYSNKEGVIQMYLHSTLYIDASEDIDLAVNKICDTLKKHHVYNLRFANKSKNLKKSKKSKKTKSLDYLISLYYLISFRNKSNGSSSPNNPSPKKISIPVHRKRTIKNILSMPKPSRRSESPKTARRSESPKTSRRSESPKTARKSDSPITTLKNNLFSGDLSPTSTLRKKLFDKIICNINFSDKDDSDKDSSHEDSSDKDDSEKDSSDKDDSEKDSSDKDDSEKESSYNNLTLLYNDVIVSLENDCLENAGERTPKRLKPSILSEQNLIDKGLNERRPIVPSISSAFTALSEIRPSVLSERRSSVLSERRYGALSERRSSIQPIISI